MEVQDAVGSRRRIVTGRVEVDRGTIVEIPAKFALACLSNCVGVPSSAVWFSSFKIVGIMF